MSKTENDEQAEAAAIVSETAEAPQAKPKAKARAATGKKPPKPREIAPGKVQAVDPDELRELIGMAGKVEIAFSDGEKEIAALAPVIVQGDAWVAGVTGLRLRVDELIVHGPDGGAAVEVAGYGLLLDGALHAYRARFEPMLLRPGQRSNLADEFVF